MRALILWMAALVALAPAAAPAQYEPPAKPADPAAQLAELIALYDEVCLRAFPDDAAAARAIARHRAEPLSNEDVARFLHDDPGYGWRVAGRTGRFDVTIEQSPPYHSCAVRTMTAAGFPDMGPYQRLAQAFERGRGFTRINPMDRVIDGLRVVGGGEGRSDPDGSSESLLIAISSPAGDARAGGMTAVEVRFAHQFYGRGAVQAPKP